MFVRAKRRFKDGKEHRYWSVVESCRNRDGRVVQRQVLYLGAHPPASGFEVFVTVGERSGMWLSGMVCGWGSLMVTGG